jgi:hypothetical protein
MALPLEGQNFFSNYPGHFFPNQVLPNSITIDHHQQKQQLLGLACAGWSAAP